MEGRDETSILQMATASMYHHGMSVPFSVKRAAKAALRRNEVLTELGSFTQASKDIIQSLDYLESLPQQLIGKIFSSVHLKFEREDELQATKNRTP